ncbi:MAG: glycosyl hydrolase [Actinomycetota bacterium]|nr:glycosyl hydrolase [Actinomycetota bacterium]
MRTPLLPALAAAVTLSFAVTACGSDTATVGQQDAAGAETASAPDDPRAELEHIHGLGVDPGSGSLYVATHYGLFTSREGQVKLERVGESQQDVMGFSVVGPGRFIGSGHPDPSQELPPNLGLIASTDEGKSFENVSLLGKADFHVLRAAGRQVYGFDGASGKLMVSTDGGRKWTSRTPPAGVFDLAISPEDPQRIVASTEKGLFSSANAGETWRPLPVETPGLLAWSAPDSLVLIDGAGKVARSSDAGASFADVGSIPGPPSAFGSDKADLYAALGDGQIVQSTDGGASWAVRATP